MKKYLYTLILSLVSSSVFADNYHNRTERLLNTSLKDFKLIIPYDDNYVAYSVFSKNINIKPKKMQIDELKGQFSFAIPLYKGLWDKTSLLGFSHTQSSYFQARNVKESSPFRDTNYSPTIFLAWSKNFKLPLGFKTEDFEIGYQHQSNGRGRPEYTRSWDRLYARVGFSRSFAEKGDLFIGIKLWARLKVAEYVRKIDQNPSILKYRSIGDITVGYKYKQHQFKLKGHYNPLANKGGLEIAYSYPITKWMSFYSQVFTGYGENLIDYDKMNHRFAVGLSFSDLF